MDKLKLEVRFLRKTQASIRALLSLGGEEESYPEKPGDEEYSELLMKRKHILTIQKQMREMIGAEAFAPAFHSSPMKGPLSPIAQYKAAGGLASPQKTDSLDETFFEAGQDFFKEAEKIEAAKAAEAANSLAHVETWNSSNNLDEEVAEGHGPRETSYDRLPLREVISPRKVRGKKRKTLAGYACKECEKYYANAGLSSKNMQRCTRHRGRKPPASPKGYWDVDMISTQEIEERQRAQCTDSD